MMSHHESRVQCQEANSSVALASNTRVSSSGDTQNRGLTEPKIRCSIAWLCKSPPQVPALSQGQARPTATALILQKEAKAKMFNHQLDSPSACFVKSKTHCNQWPLSPIEFHHLHQLIHTFLSNIANLQCLPLSKNTFCHFFIQAFIHVGDQNMRFDFWWIACPIAWDMAVAATTIMSLYLWTFTS